MGVLQWFFTVVGLLVMGAGIAIDLVGPRCGVRLALEHQSPSGVPVVPAVCYVMGSLLLLIGLSRPPSIAGAFVLFAGAVVVHIGFFLVLPRLIVAFRR